MMKQVMIAVALMFVAARAVDHPITWQFGVQNSLTVTAGDTVTLNVQPGHNANSFADSTHFDNCNFAGATAYTGSVTAVLGQDLYFGCSIATHCASSAVKMHVTVVPGSGGTGGMTGGMMGGSDVSSSSSAVAISSSSSAAPVAPTLTGCWEAPTCLATGSGTSKLRVPSLSVTSTGTGTYDFVFTEFLSLNGGNCDDLELKDTGHATIGASTNVVANGFEFTRVTTKFEITPLQNSSIAIMDTYCKCGLTWHVGGTQEVPSVCIGAGGCLLKSSATQYSISSFSDATDWAFGDEDDSSATGWSAQGPNPVALTTVVCDGGSTNDAYGVTAPIVSVLVMMALVVVAIL